MIGQGGTRFPSRPWFALLTLARADLCGLSTRPNGLVLRLPPVAHMLRGVRKDSPENASD